ncbi:LysR family transcriptional regulator [Herbaspirillum sp. AP02]|jgi:LysR family glycine cleavage system transcriptional activator|uniref:LysR family transcription regulator protein n=1 Tax=Herbaspirillum frisingense GSF30 TaxID=864073 RepID=A0AAI9IGF3_9BURK|nr:MULTISPECIES: LysR substrate-binding domain-containing protein [Herbaspirillum]EOA05748.1 LysR family transcription regulator protein [Herbaspirillum frisingense GSF30]MBG7618872.1 LysR family transcriptional regulator [Herbaspirillum sp. AP02]NZD67326.1 LysR family transcriptional regulator [Herbaspirillum sp. AP21]ONN68188.1 LysR family transcriptional regulator [Herbaspirillum sp. VT-16-41]QNB06868.1 LysR family transcriptional regulator [Herbaspirillum frisingense]
MADLSLPLNAIRAFLAAARHQSFTLAAHELNVTHGAISRQIKNLEDYLGMPLFERRVRQVLLTERGRQFFEEASPALDILATAARRVMRDAPTRTVVINVRPSFAVRWLIPHLSDFVERYPGIAPQVVTSTAAVGRAGSSFDIAVRRGETNWPESLKVQRFMEDELVLVASPALLKSMPLEGVAGIGRHTLLLSRSRRNDWEDWRRLAGLKRSRGQAMLYFDHVHFVLQAVVDGLGLALSPVSLADNDLRSGRLVCPLPDLRMALAPYYLGISPQAGAEALLFAKWLGEYRGMAGFYG